MRLTLRTLLAYMDDILDPADQEELGRKIESSAFATELIHRSRDAVRRLRLSAPEALGGASDDIHGADSNLDANTAAEYLDNTLSPDAVAEFERTCLEAGTQADMLLAEAASCHHVLTMVLGEPAEVDGDLRQRMYNLLEQHGGQHLRIEPAHAGSGAAATAAATAVAPVRTTRPSDADEAAVPDFMLAAAQQARRTRRRTIMALAAAALLGGSIPLYQWLTKEGELPKELAGKAAPTDVVIGDVESEKTSSTIGAAANSSTADLEAPPFPGPPATGDQETPSAATDQTARDTVNPSTEAATMASKTPAAAPVLPPLDEKTPGGADFAETTGGVATADAGAAPTDSPAAPTGAAAAPPPVPAEATTPADAATPAAGEVAASDPAMTDEGATPPAPPTASAATPSETPLPPAGVDGDAAPEATSPSEAGTAAPSTSDAAAGTAAAPLPPDEGVAAEAPKQVGDYLGNNDVLLRFDAASGAWLRLPPRSALTAGDRLLSLPTFRTHVVLGNVNVHLAGGAEINLATNRGGAGTLALAAPYGQFIFHSGRSGNRLELTLGDQTRVVTLEPSSSLAIDVRRSFVSGAAPGTQIALTEIVWYLTSGNATWSGEGLTGASAEGPAMWTTVAGEDSAPAAIEELPKWVDEESITVNERRARDMVAESLPTGEPVNTRLLELADRNTRGRLTEVRALAARSGAYVGLFDPLVKALGDVDQRASWEEQVQALRDAIARDPAAAEAIAEAFAAQRGEAASKDLMEMVLGFNSAAVGTTREQVQNGALVRLIRWMDDEDLVYRILASYNVNEILGTNYLGGYRPQHTKSQRERELNHYWQRLERGELMPKGAEATP